MKSGVFSTEQKVKMDMPNKNNTLNQVLMKQKIQETLEPKLPKDKIIQTLKPTQNIDTKTFPKVTIKQSAKSVETEKHNLHKMQKAFASAPLPNKMTQTLKPTPPDFNRIERLIARGYYDTANEMLNRNITNNKNKELSRKLKDYKLFLMAARDANNYIKNGSFGRAFLLIERFIEKGRGRQIPEELQNRLNNLKDTAFSLSKTNKLLREGRTVEALDILGQVIKGNTVTLETKEGLKGIKNNIELYTKVKGHISDYIDNLRGGVLVRTIGCEAKKIKEQNEMIEKTRSIINNKLNEIGLQKTGIETTQGQNTGIGRYTETIKAMNIQRQVNDTKLPTRNFTDRLTQRREVSSRSL